MAKIKSSRPDSQQSSSQRSVRSEILICDLFKETAARHNIFNTTNPVATSFKDFLKLKIESPIAPYGSSDKTSPVGTPIQREIPKIRHAHLTHDLSVWYKIEGKDPTKIYLFAIMSHDESGTGQPPSDKRQRGVASRMKNQEFSPFNS